MSRYALIFVVSWGLQTLGCKTAPACPVALRTDPTKVLEEQARRTETWTSLKAEARVTQWAERGRVRGTVLMFLEKPSRVRIDVMTQLGPAAVLTSDAESFQLTDLRENVFLQGPTCPENIARLLGFAVAAEDVIGFLTGDTPTIVATERRLTCRDGNYVVTLVATDRSMQEIVFSIDDPDQPAEAQRLTLRSSSLRRADGSPQWEVTYADYRAFEGQSFPTKIHFVDHDRDAETQVRVKSISLNPSVPAEAFRQTPHPSMTMEVAPCR